LHNALALQFSKIRNNVPTLVQVVIIDAELYDTVNDIAFLSRVLTPDTPRTLWKGTTSLGRGIVPLTVGDLEIETDFAFTIFHKVLKHWKMDASQMIELNAYSIAQLKVMNTPSDALNNLTEDIPNWGKFPE
jgi:hypothetical protein